MDTLHQHQTFNGELLATVRKLRDRSAREWGRNPLLAKTLEHIRDYVEVLVSTKFTPDGEAVARATWLDSLQNLDCLELEVAFDIEADLRVSLLELAGDEYLLVCLQHEQRRLALPRDNSDPNHRWTDLFPESVLTKLLEDFGNKGGPPPRNAAIEHLAELYRQSHHDLRRNRARAMQIGRYLRLFSPLLAVLLVVVATLLGGVPAFDQPAPAAGRWAELIALAVAMLAGAVGGVLGLMFRFRDAHGRLRELLSDNDVRWVQPLLGAAMALAVVLIIKSELITVAGWTLRDGALARLAALGFVAGFSEPLFFGVIGRVAAAASPGPKGGKT